MHLGLTYNGYPEYYMNKNWLKIERRLTITAAEKERVNREFDSL